MKDKNWSYRFPLGFTDMNEWSVFNFKQVVDEPQARVTVPEGKDFIGLYFNLGKAHEYKITGHEQQTIEGGQYNFIFLPAGSAQLTVSRGSYSSLCIEFTPVILKKLKEDFPMVDRLLKCADRKVPVVLSNVNMVITGRMREAIQEILVDKYNFGDQLREFVRHSKVISLLFYSLDNMKVLSAAHLRKSEMDKVVKVHDYLLQHFRGTYAVNQIADMFDIERRKLERAFKVVYRTGVYRFFLDEKLKQAALLLRDTNLPAKQIAREVGFGLFARFSEAFKKYYGFSPADFRKLGV